MMHKKKENLDALTVSEVGKILNLSPQTIRKLMKDGEIPFFKVGNNYRIRSEDVKKLITQQE